MSDRDKDAEILTLRHQITVLKRQSHGEKIHSPVPTARFSPRRCTDCPATWFAASGY
jgi:hypothetical protein